LGHHRVGVIWWIGGGGRNHCPLPTLRDLGATWLGLIYVRFNEHVTFLAKGACLMKRVTHSGIARINR
jgi:hypothetical protein